MFVVWVLSGVICGNLRSVHWITGSVICQCLTFFVHLVVSAWLLKCTKNIGPNGDVVQWRLYVRTEGRWAKGSRWEGVSQAVVGMLMNLCVLLKTRNRMRSWECGDFDSYNVQNLQSSCSIISFDESVCHYLSWQVTLMLCWFYRAAQK
jgi:hypothetical protein